MPPSANRQQIMQEQALLNHVKRLERGCEDHLVAQIHLSSLVAFEQLPECLAVARTIADRAAKTHDASLYPLFNHDLFLIYNRASAAHIEKVIDRLCGVLKEDPFFASGADAEEAFCSRFDLTTDYGELVQRAEDLNAQKAEQEAAERLGRGKRTNKKPLNLAGLAAVEKAIAQADLSAMTSRQAICEFGEDGKPRPLFYELFTSISALSDTLLPDQNVFADRWLFQYLTAKLDHRMLAWLDKNDDSTLKHSFSLNINIASLLSPRFLEFDESLDQARRNTIIVELQMHDVFADIARYLFAREFLLDRGYRIALDGVTELSLPLVDRVMLGAELVKLQWSYNLRGHIEGRFGDRLRGAIEKIDPKRIIFTRCESDDAVELGHELGVVLFQGYFLDHLLSEKISREEAVERLSAALARHRRMAVPSAAASS